MAAAKRSILKRISACAAVVWILILLAILTSNALMQLAHCNVRRRFGDQILFESAELSLSQGIRVTFIVEGTEISRA